MQLTKTFLFITSLISLAWASANPFPFASPNPQTGEDGQAVAECNNDPRCSILLRILAKCLEEYGLNQISKTSECGCKQFVGIEKEIKSCFECFKEKGSDFNFAKENNKICNKYGVNFDLGSGAPGSRMSGAQWAGMAAGAIIAGGLVHGEL